MVSNPHDINASNVGQASQLAYICGFAYTWNGISGLMGKYMDELQEGKLGFDAKGRR